MLDGLFRNQMNDCDRPCLVLAPGSGDPLLQPRRVPGEVAIDDHARVLEIQARGARIRAEKDAAVRVSLKCVDFVPTALLALVFSLGIACTTTGAVRADDSDLLAYLLEQYSRGPRIDIPTDDRFDVTRFLGQPDPYVPEPYRWSWAERYFYDGVSPAPWFSIPWPVESWRGPF